MNTCIHVQVYIYIYMYIRMSIYVYIFCIHIHACIYAHAGSLGAPRDVIPWLLADRVVAPVEYASHYSEALVYLPGMCIYTYIRI